MNEMNNHGQSSVVVHLYLFRNEYHWVSGKNWTDLYFAQAARAFTFFLQVKRVNKKSRRY